MSICELCLNREVSNRRTRILMHCNAERNLLKATMTQECEGLILY
jgi:hypothetical protein